MREAKKRWWVQYPRVSNSKEAVPIPRQKGASSKDITQDVTFLPFILSPRNQSLFENIIKTTKRYIQIKNLHRKKLRYKKTGGKHYIYLNI